MASRVPGRTAAGQGPVLLAHGSRRQLREHPTPREARAAGAVSSLKVEAAGQHVATCANRGGAQSQAGPLRSPGMPRSPRLEASGYRNTMCAWDQPSHLGRGCSPAGEAPRGLMGRSSGQTQGGGTAEVAGRVWPLMTKVNPGSAPVPTGTGDWREDRTRAPSAGGGRAFTACVSCREATITVRSPSPPVTP